MEIVKENVRASQFVGHENLVELVEGDIIVPDIKPDILSLIKVDGKAFITNKEVMDGKVRLQGMVDVYAIYMSDDETNSMRGLTATLNFNETLDVKDCNVGMVPIVKYHLLPVESRVLNGRKITVKCPIEIDVSVMDHKEFEISKDVTECDNVQVLKEEVTVNSFVGCNTEDVSINENVSLPENAAPVAEILDCSFDIVNKDYKVSYNKVLAKADAKVRIVYLADDEAGSIQTFETLLPFTGFIDIAGVNDNTEFNIEYDTRSYYIKPVYQDMKATAIGVEAEVEMLAVAYEPKTFVVIQDLYNPDAVLNYDVKNIRMEQNTKKQNYTIKLDQVLSIPELENSKLLEATVRPTITEKRVLDDKIVVEGNANVDLLYYKLDKRTIEEKKIELPFQQTISTEKRNNAQDEILLEVSTVEYELQPSGQLRMNIELTLKHDVMELVELNVIDNLVQTNEQVTPIASIVVYPVKQGDSLWKIAKKFHTTVECIMKANDLTDDKIYPMQQLIIPRRVCRVELDPLA